MYFLYPDRNKNILNYYHKSSKIMIPFFGLSFISNYLLESNIIDYINVVNVGFHSYVSTSCIITDYIKIKNFEKMIRIVNLKSHTFAGIGFIYYLSKNK